MKKIKLLITTSLLGLVVLSCGGSKNDVPKAEVKSDVIVKVGTEGVYAPFTFKDETGKLTGYDVEVVEALASKAGIKVEFIPTPWDSMFLGLESKKFDFIANQIGKNPEREAKYLFSDSYLVSAAQIIVKKGRTDIKSLEDLKGKKVITSVGSNYNKILLDFDKNKEIKLDYNDGDVSSAFQLISEGRADAILNDRLTVGYYIKQKGDTVEAVGEPIVLSPTHFVFRKDSSELQAKINKALQELKADGTLAKISEKWFVKDYTK